MAKTKATNEDSRSQRQKFIDAAREHGADSDEDAFRSAVHKVASAPAKKAKKPARKNPD
jgi:hypothetical protein